MFFENIEIRSILKYCNMLISRYSINFKYIITKNNFKISQYMKILKYVDHSKYFKNLTNSEQFIFILLYSKHLK